MSTLDSCELLDDELEASKCDVLPDGIKLSLQYTVDSFKPGSRQLLSGNLT